MRHYRRSSRSYVTPAPTPRPFPILVPIAGFLFGLIIVFLAMTFVRTDGQSFISPLGNGIGLFTRPTPTPTPGPGPMSLLLMGYGGPGHDGPYLTDTMIQLVIQPNDKRILLISIPRDLYVKIPVAPDLVIDDKINEAFGIGLSDDEYPNKAPEYKATKNPGALVKTVAGNATGIPVNSYFGMTFSGFIKAVDTLGGIDVNFPVDFDDFRYPIQGKEDETCGISPEDVATMSAALSGDKLEEQFPCRFEHVHVDGGLQHLDGELALKVVRSRHSVNLKGDFSRSDRQREVIGAIKTRIFQIGFLPKAIPFFLSLGTEIKTDVNVTLLQSILPYAQELASYKIISIALTDENVLVSGMNYRGQFILSPRDGDDNYTGVWSYIQREATKSGGLLK
jgi:anionic cell wall polymer biosynthesis LytR-Cps2A-Psr (LCP) family protein